MKFYLLANGIMLSGLSLDNAIENSGVAISQDGYVALGVEDDEGACDLLVKVGGELKISNDYKSTRFKDFKYITDEVIPTLKSKFGVN